MTRWSKRVLSWLVHAWLRNAGSDAAREADSERRLRNLEERGRNMFLP